MSAEERIRRAGGGAAVPAAARLLLTGSSALEAGGAVEPLPPTLPNWLLAVLAVRATPVARDELAALCWPEEDEDAARHRLRTHLHRLRQWLQERGLGDTLQAGRQQLVLALDSDVAAFRRALGRGDRAQALPLVRGPLLEGWRGPGFPLLEEWAEVERRQIDAAWRSSAARHAQALAEAGDSAGALAWLERVLAAEPLAEDVLQSLLRLAGQQAEGAEVAAALRHHEAFRERLRAELDAEPMRETEALAAALRHRHALQPAPQPAPPPPLPTTLLDRPPLVGREALLARLQAAAGAAPLLVGPAGIGKSALLEAALPAATRLRCREGLEGLALHPLAELLRAQRERLAAALPQHAAEFARLVPDYLDGAPPPLDPELGRARLFDALLQALQALGAQASVDDLQWADPVTLEWLACVLPRGGLQWAFAQRGGEGGEALRAFVAAQEGAGRLAPLPVAPLPEPALRTLLARLAGQAEGPPRFAAWLARASGGNPFFALELLRSLFDSGRLHAAPEGGWASDLDGVTQDYSELALPPRVKAVVQARCARLPGTAQRVLEAAAVAGDMALEPALLAALCGLAVDTVADAMDLLEAAGLLAGQRFAHDLVRQAVHEGLPEGRRRRLHRRAALALAALPPSRAVEPALLAAHWRAAGDAQAALPAAFGAAQALRERGGLDESARAFERIAAEAEDPALALQARTAAAEHLLLSDLRAEQLALDGVRAELDGLPPGPASERAHLRVHTALAENAVYRGDLQAAQRHVKALQETLDAAPRAERAHALEVVLEVTMRRGDFESAHRALQRARREHPRSVTLRIYGPLLALTETRLDEAIEGFRELLRLHPEHARYVTVENDLGVALHQRGRPLEAREWIERGLQTWAGVPHAQCLSSLNLGAVLCSLGEWAAAEATLQRALALAREQHSALFEGEALHRLGRALWLQQRPAEAAQALQAALECLPPLADPLRQSRWHAQAVPVALALRDSAAAARHLEAAATLLEGREHPLSRACLERARAQRALQRGDTGAAAQAAAAMLALARRHAMDELLCEALLLRAAAGPPVAAGAADRAEALALAGRLGLRPLLDAAVRGAPA